MTWFMGTNGKSDTRASSLPTTADRVVKHTSECALDAIDTNLRLRLDYFARHKDEIPQRLRELDAEWDVERCLETGSATLTLTGIALGATLSRKWFLLAAVVQGFFLQHALQGWCPPLPVLRGLGVRTADEINQERYALKGLLGEFANAGESDSADELLDAIGRRRGAAPA